MENKNEIVSYDTNAVKPTDAQFQNYQALFDYFNDALFSGELPPIILNFSRKGKNVGGFFAPKRWTGIKHEVHEISLNPDCIHHKDPKELVAVLVHEMVHLWQQEFGKAPRGGYHDKQWGQKMEFIGLMPSNTSAPGGKRTGQQMSHYVIEGGGFDFAYADMPKSLLLPFQQIEQPPKMVKSKTKTKYTCPTCDTNVWGKDGLKVTCNECGDEFEAED